MTVLLRWGVILFLKHYWKEDSMKSEVVTYREWQGMSVARLRGENKGNWEFHCGECGTAVLTSNEGDAILLVTEHVCVPVSELDG